MQLVYCFVWGNATRKEGARVLRFVCSGIYRVAHLLDVTPSNACNNAPSPSKNSLSPFLLARRKVTPKKGTRRKFLTPGSVVLGTFRKLGLRPQTVRNASPSSSVARLNFRMGTMQEAPIQIFTPNPAYSRSGPMNFLGTRLGLRERPAGRTRTV